LGIDPRWLTLARAVVAALLLALFWRRYVELRGAARLAVREYWEAIGVGLAVFALWINLDQGWMVVGDAGPGFVPLDRDGHLDIALAAARFVALAAVVPVMEELFWRSYLMRRIEARDFLGRDPRRTSWLGWTVSSALFASEHSLWIAGLVAGAAYGGLYARSGNLRSPLISHAITNATLGLWILATGQWRFW
jgi:CAAX prenyl protease-like protein